MKYLSVSNVLITLGVVLFVLNMATGNLLASAALFVSTCCAFYAKLRTRELSQAKKKELQ